MKRALHPAEKGLITAATLRGYRLEDGKAGNYRVFKEAQGAKELIADNASFKAVANLCGATGNVTLKQAAARDGFVWPA
jgi:hypothetical protein